ncbi:hypothetical protein [Mogibacterium diversum]|uniref:hypothetical protein n=1 Tax=Mogibacterium diversum TaxID=114527 RepID=UPI0028D28175|nr:hypothetical protein [Mogibacterium diversum]
MSQNVETRVCKNKKCQKVLPAGYKNKYCEACKNKHVEKAKKTIKNIGTGAVTFASIALVVVKGGKIKP